MRTLLLAGGFSIALALTQVEAVASQTLYDIDFAAPFHQPLAPATIDLGPAPRRGPSANNFQEPLVISDYNEFTEGALRFEAPSEDSYLSQIGLDVEDVHNGLSGVDYPAYSLEFDLIIESLGSAADDFTVLFDAPQVNTFSLRGDGLIWYGPGVGFIGDFEFGDPMRVAVMFETDAEMWRIEIDGETLYEGATQNDAISGLEAVRLSLEDRNERGAVVHVDNIQLRGVPSPGTLAILGAFGLYRPRSRLGRV